MAEISFSGQLADPSLQRDELKSAQQDLATQGITFSGALAGVHGGEAARQKFYPPMVQQPQPETKGPHGLLGSAPVQAGLRVLTGAAETTADMPAQLLELIPGLGDEVQKVAPGGRFNFDQRLEELGLLAEAGTMARVSEGIGEIGAWFIPINVTSNFLRTLSFAGKTIPKVVSTFLPIGAATYASMHAKAANEKRDLEPGEVGLAAAQVLGTALLGKVGERFVFPQLAKAFPPAWREAVIQHASNAALGGLLEGAGAAISGDPHMGERIVEGTVGSVLGAMVANRFPGLHVTSKSAAKGVVDAVKSDMEKGSKDLNEVRPGPEDGFVPRSKFASRTREAMIREAPVVAPEAWPPWLNEYVRRQTNGVPEGQRFEDLIGLYSFQGMEPREIAVQLRDLHGDTRSRTVRENYILATKAKLGIPSSRDAAEFMAWQKQAGATYGSMPIAPKAAEVKQAQQAERTAQRETAQKVRQEVPKKIQGLKDELADAKRREAELLRNPAKTAEEAAAWQDGYNRARAYRENVEQRLRQAQGVLRDPELDLLQTQQVMGEPQEATVLGGKKATPEPAAATTEPAPTPARLEVEQVQDGSGKGGYKAVADVQGRRFEVFLGANVDRVNRFAEATQGAIDSDPRWVPPETSGWREVARAAEPAAAPSAPPEAQPVAPPEAKPAEPAKVLGKKGRAKKPKAAEAKAPAAPEGAPPEKGPEPAAPSVAAEPVKPEEMERPRMAPTEPPGQLLSAHSSKQSAETFARAYDMQHLDSPPTVVVKVGKQYQVYAPKATDPVETQTEHLQTAKDAAPDSKGHEQQVTEMREKAALLRQKLGAKGLKPEERAALHGELEGLEADAALAEKMFLEARGREELAKKKAARKQQGTDALKVLALGAGAAAAAAYIEKKKGKGAENLALAAVPLLLGRRFKNFHWADQKAAHDFLLHYGEAARTQLTDEEIGKLVESLHEQTMYERGTKLTQEDIDKIHEIVGRAAEDPDFVLQPNAVRPPGAFRRAVTPVLQVLRTNFGPYGNWLADGADKMLYFADRREGALLGEMKQIRIPGTRGPENLYVGRTLGDPMGKKDHENALDIWDWWSRRYVAQDLRERGIKVPEGLDPNPMTEPEPEARSSHVAVVTDAMLKYYFGRDYKSTDENITSAADEFVGFLNRLMPAFAKEAYDKGIWTYIHNGQSRPFQAHLGPNGKYMPYIMAERSNMLQEWEHGHVEHNRQAFQIRKWMVDHLAADTHTDEGSVWAALSNADLSKHLPYHRATLGATIKHAGYVERSRLINTPIGMDIDPGRFVPKYIRSAIIRFEYINQFGRTAQTANKVIQAAAKDGYPAEPLIHFFDLATEQSPDLLGSAGLDRALREMTGFASLTKLSWAGIGQLGSMLPIQYATRLSHNPLAPGNWRAFFAGFTEALNKSMVDLGLTHDQQRLVRAQLLSSSGAPLEGDRINWVMQMRGLMPKLASFGLHFLGVVPLDRFMRNWAGAAGRSFADVMGFEMENALAKKDLGALKKLKTRLAELNLPTESLWGGKLNPLFDLAHWSTLDARTREEYRNAIGWTVAYRTQGRTRAGDLPELATHKYLKALYKFSPFAIRQTAETFRQIRQDMGKDPVAFAKYLMALLPVGAGAWAINHVRTILREPNEEKRKLRAAQDPLINQLEQLAGFANIAPWIFDWTQSASHSQGLAKRLMGPVFGQVSEFSEYAAPGLFKLDPGPTMRYFIRTGVGVPGFVGASGTPLGRLLGVPSGREVLEGKPPLSLLGHSIGGPIQAWPGVGKFVRDTKPGKTGYSEAWMRSRYPGVARVILGKRKANNP